MEDATSCPPGAGGVAKKQVTHALIKDIVTKALQDRMPRCQIPTWIDLFATSPASSQVSSHTSIRSTSSSRGNKRRASSFSTEEETGSDSTVIGSGTASDNESSSGKSATGKVNASQTESFTLVKGKNKKAIRKALKKSKTSDVSPSDGMDVDASRDASATNNVVVKSLQTHGLSATPTQVAVKSPSVAGAKPTAPPRSKVPPLFFCAKAQTF
ncbi:hypothetical protein EVAR_4281_1 [Eumeta japonica]|uniref:Uncharacterized protein n=1 Tax=Eumeta variegata TaxID=151549 RepID=A0A4C1VCY9_EUMVA|nr:hypothetical protein EVAR_4281_1 [Eumeta japonica]